MQAGDGTERFEVSGVGECLGMEVNPKHVRLLKYVSYM